MTDNPNFGATQEDAEYQARRVIFTGGFFPGVILQDPKPVPPADTVRTREELLKKLVDLSRTLPQIGVLDPAGVVERASASTSSAQAPESAKPKATRLRRKIIQKILGR